MNSMNFEIIKWRGSFNFISWLIGQFTVSYFRVGYFVGFNKESSVIKYEVPIIASRSFTKVVDDCVDDWVGDWCWCWWLQSLIFFVLLVYKIRFLAIIRSFLQSKFFMLFTAGNLSRKAEHEKFHWKNLRWSRIWPLLKKWS